MSKLLTEPEISEIADRFDCDIDQVRSAARETVRIDNKLREYPNFDIADAIMSVVHDKWISGEYALENPYSFEEERKKPLNERDLRNFANVTGINFANLKAAATKTDEIDKLMKEHDISYLDALLRLY